MSELYGESVNDTKIEEYLKESSISQDDYKKLKQENENYRQEVHVLRLKLGTSNELIKDLQNSGDTLETHYKTHLQQLIALASEKEGRYKTEQKEYENQIADLETNQVKSELEIKQLQEELKKCKNLINKPCQTDNISQYKEELRELSILLKKNKEILLQKEQNEKELMDKLAYTKDQLEELQHNLNKTTKHLVEKDKELEKTQESARELAAKLEELELSDMVPASDTCKGNSLFAEVEDRRQMLLDKVKVLSNKYSKAKQALDLKTSEVKLLTVEKIAISRKWETDAIDTLQENADLLNKYKSRVFDLKTKLKAEMKKNEEVEEIQSTDNSFNFAQQLLIAKRKELKELNERIEKLTMQTLVQEEVNHNLSKQLRYWQCKAMYLEAQTKAIKDQLEMEDKYGNKILLETLNNCTFPDNVNFEKVCDYSLTPHELMPKDILKHELAEQENSTELPKNPVVDPTNVQKEFKKVVGFTGDTKDSESKSLKKQTKKQDYPVIIYN